MPAPPWRPIIPQSWRALLVFVVAMLPLAAGVFLLSSDFFVRWNGQAVSVRPSNNPDPAVYTVLVVNHDGTRLERTWDADLVEQLSLPVDPLALPPPTIPETRPHTSKLRFTMHFLVDVPIQGADEVEARVVPTTSPRGLGLALAFLVLVVGIRNMIWSGSPFSLERRAAFLPKQQAQAGAPVPPGGPGRPRGRKAPPPSRRRRGRGRR